MGPVKYIPPKGFPISFYPYKNQDNYRTPIAFVKFDKPKYGTLIQVWCRIWAANIKHHKNDKAGSIHFELLVDWPPAAMVEVFFPQKSSRRVVRRANPQNDQQMPAWMDGRIGGRMNGWLEEWMYGWIGRWMKGWMEGWIDGRMSGLMNQLIKGWMELLVGVNLLQDEGFHLKTYTWFKFFSNVKSRSKLWSRNNFWRSTIMSTRPKYNNNIIN